MILQILTLLGAVTLFLFGLSLLSGGLQNVAGDGLRSFLASMTSNPFKQIITGIGVTTVYYIDLVYELEKMGDFIINVSQAILKENELHPATA